MNKSITTQQIDAILPFLEKFEAGEFSAGTWHNEPGQMPSFNCDESVMEFRKALYDNNWVQPFDWNVWQDIAQEYVESPVLLESADVETICKLFTTHVRNDRFCESHLAAMFENSHIVALLKRLQQIRDEM